MVLGRVAVTQAALCLLWAAVRPQTLEPAALLPCAVVTVVWADLSPCVVVLARRVSVEMSP